ncbi:MAG: hypothetical protein ABFC63_04980 [Thermoguttaceae bacterium]
MTLDDSSRQVRRFRLRLAVLLSLRECLRLASVWIMAWAAAVVALRAVFRIDPALLLWGGVGLAVVVVVGLVLANRKLPAPSAIRAMLDACGSLGGLLMAAEVADIGLWNIEQVATPSLRWRPHRQLSFLLMSVSFLVAAFLAPDRYIPAGDDALHVGGEIRKLAERVQILKQEDILPPERAKAIEKDLRQLEKDALGKDPAKTMEAIDHLDQACGKAAAEAAESLIRQAEKAAKAEALSAALQAAQGQLDPDKMAESMKDLTEAAEKLAAENKALADELDSAIGDCNDNLSTEQLQQIGEVMKDCKACSRCKLAKLVQGRLVDGDQLLLFDEAAQGDQGALLAELSEDGDELLLSGAAAPRDGDGLPGRGGINRGRADAAMTWQDKVQRGDAAFKEKALPPAAAASLKESKRVGMSVGNPTAAKPGNGSVGGVLKSSAAGGGESRTRTILPEHEKAVQRYFNREKK